MSEETRQLPAELTDEEVAGYRAKCAELEVKYRSEKIHPIVMIEKTTKERIVCYVKDPEWTVQIKIMDMGITQGLYTSADYLRELITLKEESDPRTYEKGKANDKYRMGVLDFCLGLAERCQNQIKKN